MDSRLPLYRQLFSRFFILAISFVAILAITIAVYFFQGQQLNALSQQKYPQLIDYTKLQALLIKHSLLLDEVNSSKRNVDYQQHFIEVNDSLNQVVQLSSSSKSTAISLLQQHKLQQENIRRIEQNIRRNAQLNHTLLIQLEIAKDSLNSYVAQQLTQQRELKMQLASDRLSDRVTAERAKTLATATEGVNRHQQLIQQMINALVLFNHLSEQQDLVEFDYIQQQLQAGINAWLSLMTSQNNSDLERTLFEQIKVLNELLFIEHNAFAKLRGQVRLINQYRNSITQQKQQLLALLPEANIAKVTTESGIEQTIIQWLSSVGVSVNKQQLLWGLLALLSLLLLSFVFTLISLRSKIKAFSQSLEQAVAHYIQGDKHTEASSLEITTLLQQLTQLDQPAHSEQDFQQLVANTEQRFELMSHHLHVCDWHLPTQTADSLSILSLFLTDIDVQRHWRRCFSPVSVRAILASAKLAKKEGRQSLRVRTRSDKLLMLTLEYVDASWQGTLANIEAIHCVEQKLAAQQQQYADFGEHVQTALQQAYQQQVTMLLKLQQSSLAGEAVTSYMPAIKQQLSSYYQQLLVVSLAQDKYCLNLQEIDLQAELEGIVFNFNQLSAPEQQVELSFSSAVIVEVISETELLQALCQQLFDVLSRHQASTINLKVELVDKNTAQQVLRFSYTLLQSTVSEVLLEQMNLLVDEVATVASNDFKLLNSLFKLFNVDSAQLIQREQEIGFSFDMPIALAKCDEKEPEKNVRFSNISILLLATEQSLMSKITDNLAASGAEVESLKDITLFQRQVSIKHLTEKPIDVVMLSPEVYLSDFEVVEQYVASLPVRLQPKLLVIQPSQKLPVYRHGLFSVADTPLLQQQLLIVLEQLLQSSAMNNCLVSAKEMAYYRRNSSEVIVLLAVPHVAPYLNLVRQLQWLGLKVQLSCHQQDSERQWQSGQFMLLISDFIAADYSVQFNDNLSRGVIYLVAQHERAIVQQQTALLPEQWQCSMLSPSAHISELYQVLNTWLLPIASETLSQTEQVNNESKNKGKSTKKQPLLAEVRQFDSVANSNGAELIELDVFAKNQGSAQVAAIMLEEYLEDIKLALNSARKAKTELDELQLTSDLKRMLAISKVIAARPLQDALTAEIARSLDGNNRVDSGKIEEIDLLLIAEKYQQLVDFAQAI